MMGPEEKSGDSSDEDSRMLSEPETGKKAPSKLLQDSEMSNMYGIRLSVAALKPYLARRMLIKFKTIHILEIFPNGERGEVQSMTMNELLKFVYSNIPDAEAHKFPEHRSSSPESKEVPKQGSRKDTRPQSETVGSFQQEYRPKTSWDVKELNYNDLRYLENQFHTHEEPLILVRKHAVLVSLNPLRAVVTADKLILVAPSGAESLLYVLHDYMRGIIEDSDTMFRNQGHKSTSELRGYMAMLATITALHQQDYASLATKVESALYNFKSLQNITADMQDTLRVLKNATLSQIIKISSYQRLLTLFFKNEEDLALMNLTLLKDKPHLYRKPLVDEVLNQQDDLSILVESYLMDHHAIGTKLEFLKAQIQSSEELVSFRLDMYRNDLLFVEMTLIIFMLALTVGAFVTGSFGMNLNSGIPQDTIYGFWFLSLGLTLFLIALTYLLIQRYRLTGSVPATIARGS